MLLLSYWNTQLITTHVDTVDLITETMPGKPMKQWQRKHEAIQGQDIMGNKGVIGNPLSCINQSNE